jgi:hypothetical protein
MGTVHFVPGVAVTAAGLLGAMTILFAVSKLVDLASRQRDLNRNAAIEAATVAPHAARIAPGDEPARTTPAESGDVPTDALTGAAGDQEADAASSATSPARSRSLHLRLRVAGSDYDVEVQPVGQAA